MSWAIFVTVLVLTPVAATLGFAGYVVTRVVLGAER